MCSVHMLVYVDRCSAGLDSSFSRSGINGSSMPRQRRNGNFFPALQ